MFIRVRATGTGTDADPFRFPFPTYKMVTEINANGFAILKVPDGDAADDHDAAGTPLYPILNGVPVLIGLRPLQKIAYLAKLRRRYDRIKERIDIEGIG